ncbi:hypothetical protein CORC01_03550 [Colletotrichum orchidophilum]|uniref:Uncharacterized protein n=1 Tax=Colletotrichum orchidophilum TaxID=1209926 RepID=A0A1G4BIM2_9PEZI|nr:uncharacterized protein CORC01_03550 [Colletotrichum orchidophilum]OHF01235.1 hypothetical protein CORC01_03550 [Colletotrichum orchidophilum]
MDLEDWRQEQYLSVAVKNNNTDLAQLFLDYGVNINAQDPSGEPPLYLAAGESPLSMVKFLIDRGGDVNVRTARGLTPLYGASLKSRPDVVEYLLSKGADVSIASDARNWSPLECAFDYPTVLTLLVTKARPPPDYHREAEYCDTHCTALFLAARYNKIECVKLLLKHGDPDLEFTPSSDIEELDLAKGFTPLAIASLYSGDTLAVLLEYGADLGAKDRDGFTPLNYSIGTTDSSLVRRLVNAGANLETTDNWGGDANLWHRRRGTPLEAACHNQYYNDSVVVRYLVEQRGVDINGPGSYASSALGQAFLTGGGTLITYLLTNGGSINTTDGNGLPSWFNICYRRDNALEIFDKILAHYEAVEFSASLRGKDRMSRTILHCAAHAGHLGLVERLAELEPKLIDGRDADGWSALHWAARMFCARGLRDEVLMQSYEEKAEVIRFLARKGCPGLEERVPGGERTWNVLEIAEYHGAPDVVIGAFRDMMEEKKVQVKSTKVLSKQYPDEWSCNGCNSLIQGNDSGFGVAF